jgi:dienelactone hydrolase
MRLVAGVIVAALLFGCAHAPEVAQAAPAPVVETLELTLAEQRTQVDFYLPAGKLPPRGAVILAHGFTRTRATMAGHAAALAEVGVLALVPDLPYLTDSRSNARALADLVVRLRRGEDAVPVARVVLVGFSAGGLAALLAADAPGVVGYLGLDPFDRPGGVGRDKALTLTIPARLVRAPSSACNAFSIAEPWAKALRNLEVDRVLPDASHCDFESPTDRVCQWVCGSADAARQQAVREAILEAVQRWLPTAASSTLQTNLPAVPNARALTN